MRTARKLLVVLFGVLLSLGALNAIGTAHAEEEEEAWGTIPDEDGDGLVEEFFVYGDDGPYKHYVIIWSSDDTTFEWYENPNPDEDSAGLDPGGLQDALDYAKNNLGGDPFVGKSLEASPVGALLEAGGEGPSTVWNPGDDGDDDASPGNPQAGLEEQEVLDLGEGVGSSFEFEGSADSLADQIKNGQGAGEGDTYTEGDNNDGGIVYKGPGAPDDAAWKHFGPIVNPNPEEREQAEQTAS